ncbi:hypothetical protein CXU05_03910 [Akkermansia muciniphila]|nr:hypothetical protein CXU05_03910 [Akkermansia muciniphila]
MRPETKPSQTSGYARSPGRINSRSGAIPPRPSRFSRTGTYHEPSFFYQAIFQNCVLLQKKKQSIEYQTLSIHARSSAHFKSAVNQIF